MNKDSLPDSELVKILPEPAVIVSTAGEFVSVNPAFLRAVSETRDNLNNKSLAQFSTDPAEKLSRYLQNCSRSRQMVFGSLSLKNTAGKTFEFRCEGAVVEPAAGDNGQAKIFLRFKPKETTSEKFILLTQKINELNREIKERRNAEEESRKLYLEATEASRLKDEFLAVVSHELRTPLNSILGWVQMFRTNTLNQDQAQKALETIERNARSQVQLIEDLLDVSRIITGKLRLDVYPVDIASLVESSIETVRPTAQNKSVRLQIIIDPRVGLVPGDAERLQQAVWNLLSNAIKFTPKNGRVQVRLERINSHVELTVSDTGVGIDSEFLPFVFERFRQADASKTRKFGGLGLGLAITRHLVELHGGTIHAFSQGDGKGATFTIKLPLSIFNDTGRFSNENGMREPRAAFEGLVDFELTSELENLQILVVDDTADAREMLEALLGSCGSKVELASSSAEAFEKLQNNYFDILVSDIEMPEEDGYALIKKVRRSTNINCKEIGAIALTAHARVTDRLQILNAGFDFYISKPFEPAELITVIANLSRRKK